MPAILPRLKAHGTDPRRADALKVGVGPGSICTTRVIAGMGSLDCGHFDPRLPGFNIPVSPMEN